MNNLKIYNPNSLLEQVNINEVPKIGKIIKGSGIRVISFSSNRMKKHRALVYINSPTNGIVINRNLSKEAKRFIVTYMYSYVQLYYNSEDVGIFHKLLFEEENFDKKTYNYTLRLLMPEKIFESDVKKGLDNEELAKKYKVSGFIADERRKLMERDKKKAKLKVIQGRRG